MKALQAEGKKTDDAEEIHTNTIEEIEVALKFLKTFKNLGSTKHAIRVYWKKVCDPRLYRNYKYKYYKAKVIKVNKKCVKSLLPAYERQYNAYIKNYVHYLNYAGYKKKNYLASRAVWRAGIVKYSYLLRPDTYMSELEAQKEKLAASPKKPRTEDEEELHQRYVVDNTKAIAQVKKLMKSMKGHVNAVWKKKCAPQEFTKLTYTYIKNVPVTKNGCTRKLHPYFEKAYNN